MKKFKISLDAVMLILTLTLFSKRFFGMKYHEIAGIVLLAIMIVHIAVNVKTITAMCKKFMKVPMSIKVGTVVDVLLLLCCLWIGISGVLVSHTILTGISSDSIVFKLGHMFGGALFVILLGIHIGLHICRRPMPVLAATAATVIFLCGGLYGTVKSDEVRWLSMPFSVSSMAKRPPMDAENNKMHGNDGQPGQGQEQGERRGNGKKAGRMMSTLTIGQKAENVCMFLGMMMSVSMITYWIVVLKKKKNRSV